MQFLHSQDVISAVCYKLLLEGTLCELVFGMQILYKCLCDLFRIIFGVQKKNMFYFCRFCRCFYFICGIIWIVDRFMLLVYMYFGDKESISLDADFLY